MIQLVKVQSLHLHCRRQNTDEEIMLYTASGYAVMLACEALNTLAY